MKNVLLTIAAIFIFFCNCNTGFAFAETVIIHETVNQKKEDYKIEVETIKDLTIIFKNIKNGQFRLGNKCYLEDIYFDGDITHVNISCKKIWQ